MILFINLIDIANRRVTLESLFSENNKIDIDYRYIKDKNLF